MPRKPDDDPSLVKHDDLLAVIAEESTRAASILGAIKQAGIPLDGKTLVGLSHLAAHLEQALPEDAPMSDVGDEDDDPEEEEQC